MTYSPAKHREKLNRPWTDDEINESLLREYERAKLYREAEEQNEEDDDDLQS